VRDLRSEVTVFVTTIGDETNFNDCQRHLDRQTVRFEREIIAFVAPMSAAFNEMLKRCRTKYYVQVDEDMQLFPDAIEKLIEELRRAPEHVSHVAAPLWDCHLDRPLWGVKAYRHDILRRFPFKDTLSCEIQQLDELAKEGFDVLTLPLRWNRRECFGEHGKHFTPRTIFERWERIMQKRRALRRLHWLQPWPARLLKRYVRTGSELDLYAFLGAVSGIVRELPPDREADFRSVNEEFERLNEYFGQGKAVKFAILEEREKLREYRHAWRRAYDNLLSKWRR
jgi:glycosyltransferase involved in cell wall biosynthesis